MNSELEAAIDLSESVPQDMPELDEWLRLRFKYVVGEPKAYYEMPNAWGNAERRVYIVMALCYRMPHRSTFASLQLWESYRNTAESKLVESFHQTFQNLIQSSGVALPTFVERQRLCIQINDHVEFEQMQGFSNEAIGFGSNNRPQFCPPDYELDLQDNCWKRVADRAEILKLSVRFDIPECSAPLLESAYGHKTEGMPAPLYNETTPGVDGRSELMTFDQQDIQRHLDAYPVSDPGHNHEIYGLESTANQIKTLTVPREKLLWRESGLDPKGFMEKAFDEFYSKRGNKFNDIFKELAMKGTVAADVDADQVNPYGNDVNQFARIGSKHNPLTESNYAQLIATDYGKTERITGGLAFVERCNLRKTRLARKGELGLFEERKTHPPLAGFDRLSDI